MFLLENPSIIKAIKISGLKPFDPKYLLKNKDIHIHRNITIFFRSIQSNVSLLFLLFDCRFFTKESLHLATVGSG
jgi:hypothetical protein